MGVVRSFHEGVYAALQAFEQDRHRGGRAREPGGTSRTCCSDTPATSTTPARMAVSARGEVADGVYAQGSREAERLGHLTLKR